MKTFEENWTNNKSNQDGLKFKRDLNCIYDQKSERIKIRSKCNWYEDDKKFKIQKIFKIFSESGRKLSHSKSNTFTKNWWKGNKISKWNTAKFVSVLWRVIF